MTDRSGSILMIIGLLLMAAALCLTGYNIYDDSRAGQAADSALQVLEALIPESTGASSAAVAWEAMHSASGNGAGSTGSYATDGDFDLYIPEDVPIYVLNPNIEMPVQTVNGWDYVATIYIPAIDLELPVISEWSYGGLRSTACRYSGSAYLDDLVICAHNYERHFGRLKNLSVGDRIVLKDMDGNVFLYEVMLMETLVPSSVTEMKESEWDLTLFTCTIGGANRVTVRCEKIVL